MKTVTLPVAASPHARLHSLAKTRAVARRAWSFAPFERRIACPYSCALLNASSGSELGSQRSLLACNTEGEREHECGVRDGEEIDVCACVMVCVMVCMCDGVCDVCVCVMVCVMVCDGVCVMECV